MTNRLDPPRLSEARRDRIHEMLIEDGAEGRNLSFTRRAGEDYVILVPAGTWHNVTNTGKVDLKLYALYGPPDHVPGTVHPTQEDAENDPDED